MGELGELRSRVDDAVGRLTEANDKRKRQSHGLMTLLTDLEAKYEARSEELAHSQKRIDALTRENADLSNLIDQLVRIVDTTVATGEDDPLFRASSMAENLVADWRGADGEAARDRAEPIDAPGPDAAADAEPVTVTAEVETAAPNEWMDTSAEADYGTEVEVMEAPGRDAAAEAFAALPPELRFEDVSEEELASERLDGDPGALAALLDTPLAPDAYDPLAGAFETPFESQADISDADEFEAGAFEDAAAVMEAPLRQTGAHETGEIDVMASGPTSLDDADDLDPIKEMMAADLDIPDIVLDDDEPVSRAGSDDDDTESSIRTMMARLEEAAAKAKLQSARESEDETEAAPAVAGGGAS